MCGVSLKDLLAKGPSALNCQLKVLIGFVGCTEAIALDIKKFFESVSSGGRYQQLRRELWNSDPDPEIYLLLLLLCSRILMCLLPISFAIFDLCKIDLCKIDLCEIDLCEIDLCKIGLCKIGLCKIDLCEIDLCKI